MERQSLERANDSRARNKCLLAQTVEDFDGVKLCYSLSCALITAVLPVPSTKSSALLLWRMAQTCPNENLHLRMLINEAGRIIDLIVNNQQ